MFPSFSSHSQSHSLFSLLHISFIFVLSHSIQPNPIHDIPTTKNSNIITKINSIASQFHIPSHQPLFEPSHTSLTSSHPQYGAILVVSCNHVIYNQSNPR